MGASVRSGWIGGFEGYLADRCRCPPFGWPFLSGARASTQVVEHLGPAGVPEGSVSGIELEQFCRSDLAAVGAFQVGARAAQGRSDDGLQFRGFNSDAPAGFLEGVAEVVHFQGQTLTAAIHRVVHFRPSDSHPRIVVVLREGFGQLP